MLTHPTLDHLKPLKLDGMAEAFAEMNSQDGTADLTHAEWLGLLIDRKAASRETNGSRAVCARPGSAMSGPPPKTWMQNPAGALNKALFQQLLTGKWIRDKHNLMIPGPRGVGRTWLACALAQAACREGVTGSTSACHVCLTSWKWPTRTDASAPLPQPYQNPAPDPRRLGPGSPQRKPASRPDGDLRRLLRREINPDHRPTAAQDLASSENPPSQMPSRPARAQCLPPELEGQSFRKWPPKR